MHRRARSASVLGRVPSPVGGSNSSECGVCEPERLHNGGESGRRGKPRVPPAPGSPDQWIGLPRGLQVLLGKKAALPVTIGQNVEMNRAKLLANAERTAGVNATLGAFRSV